LENKLTTKSNLTQNFLNASKLSVPAGYMLLFLVIFIPVYFYGKLPDDIPYHFNFSGQPTSFGNKVTILILPLIATIQFVLLSILPKLKLHYRYPVTITVDNEQIQKELAGAFGKLMKSSVLLVFILIEIQIIQSVYEAKLFLNHYGIIVYSAIIFIPIITYFIVANKEK
jgi:uncharacterized membrane protein